MFTAALLIIALNWKLLKCPSTVDWIEELYIHAIKYSAAGTINKRQLYATTWTSHKNKVE